MVKVLAMTVKIWRRMTMMRGRKRRLTETDFPRFRGYDLKPCLDIVRGHRAEAHGGSA